MPGKHKARASSMRKTSTARGGRGSSRGRTKPQTKLKAMKVTKPVSKPKARVPSTKRAASQKQRAASSSMKASRTKLLVEKKNKTTTGRVGGHRAKPGGGMLTKKSTVKKGALKKKLGPQDKQKRCPKPQTKVVKKPTRATGKVQKAKAKVKKPPKSTGKSQKAKAASRKKHSSQRKKAASRKKPAKTSAAKPMKVAAVSKKPASRTLVSKKAAVTYKKPAARAAISKKPAARKAAVVQKKPAARALTIAKKPAAKAAAKSLAAGMKAKISRAAKPKPVVLKLKQRQCTATQQQPLFLTAARRAAEQWPLSGKGLHTVRLTGAKQRSSQQKQVERARQAKRQRDPAPCEEADIDPQSSAVAVQNEATNEETMSGNELRETVLNAKDRSPPMTLEVSPRRVRRLEEQLPAVTLDGSPRRVRRLFLMGGVSPPKVARLQRSPGSSPYGSDRSGSRNTNRPPSENAASCGSSDGACIREGVETPSSDQQEKGSASSGPNSPVPRTPPFQFASWTDRESTPTVPPRTPVKSRTPSHNRPPSTPISPFIGAGLFF
eukprot:gnl/TRDRNA2_/TRDRNA2_174885_c1_seq5.p1 gnl/TRDRNA2_/TRDRNA2_174885_c1~~gnl/TRDRNA2_/TRDRNA2_174885_c1_seq5.p1  ORF type:complete len:550 (-),score=116.11 gnl/TRDRNA2_/TRDRNA2_174885_c1_seq5:128-1777(-)